MPIPKSSFLTVLAARGLLHQCTDLAALDAHCCVGPLRAMVRLDGGADGLHAGHLLPIMAMRWLQRSGHKPIVMIDGAATRPDNGDVRGTGHPVPADRERDKAALRRTLARFLTCGDGPTDAMVIDTSDRREPARMLTALREFSSHIPVNRLLATGSMRARLDGAEPLTLLEFNDWALRGYDLLELARRENCLLELGGSDQWSGIVTGIELARRIDQRQLFGLTTPLLSTGAGLRIGNVPGSALRLDPDRLSPWSFRQCWLATDDCDVPRFLRLFSELPLPEIERITAPKGSGLGSAKAVLADEVTRLVHGADAAIDEPVPERRVQREVA